jgi:hypothetical protein
MPEETLSLPLDTTLTTENDRAKGYQWVMDVLRNAQGEIEGKEHIAQMVNNEGYKLGLPWANDKHIAPYGLYKPVATSAQPNKKV